MVNPTQILRQLAMVFCLSTASFPPAALADGTRFIELSDGSVILGQIISFDNGIYTVLSPSLGRLRLKDSEILSIRSNPDASRAMQSSPQTPDAGDTGESFSGIERRIVSDPNVFALVMSLQQDPQILEILNDPAIMRAIASRDMESLRNNPKIRELERNPTIQKILGRMNH